MATVSTSEVLDRFRAALIARDIVPPEPIIADDRLHRCSAAGARGLGDAYLLHLDGLPAGGSPYLARKRVKALVRATEVASCRGTFPETLRGGSAKKKAPAGVGQQPQQRLGGRSSKSGGSIGRSVVVARLPRAVTVWAAAADIGARRTRRAVTLIARGRILLGVAVAGVGLLLASQGLGLTATSVRLLLASHRLRGAALLLVVCRVPT